jgi:hypothetical protein
MIQTLSILLSIKTYVKIIHALTNTSLYTNLIVC